MATQLPPGYAANPPDTSAVSGNPGPASAGTQNRASNAGTTGTDAGEYSSGVGTYTSPPQVVNPPGPPVTGGTLDTEAANGGTPTQPGIVGPINGGEVNTQVYGPPVPGNNAGGPVYRAPLPDAAATNTDTSRTATEAVSDAKGLYGPARDTVVQGASYAAHNMDTLYDSGGSGPGNVAVPGAPAQPTARARVSGARVTWAAPANTGLPITGYRVYVFPAAVTDAAMANGAQYVRTVEVNASTLSAKVDNLTSGQAMVNGVPTRLAYKFSVAALNAAGEAARSVLSAAVTPWLDNGVDTAAPAALNAPTGVAATAGAKQATVSWTRPTQDGGFDITAYVVTASTGQTATVRATGSGVTVVNEPPTSVVVSGLATGVAVTFTVQAVTTRTNGTTNVSPASTASAGVTPT